MPKAAPSQAKKKNDVPQSKNISKTQVAGRVLKFQVKGSTWSFKAVDSEAMERLAEDLGPADGLCFGQSKQIFVDMSLSGERLFGVCVHELLHAYVEECHLYDPSALQLEETVAGILQYHFREIGILAEKLAKFATG